MIKWDYGERRRFAKPRSSYEPLGVRNVVRSLEKKAVLTLRANVFGLFTGSRYVRGRAYGMLFGSKW